MNNTSLSALIFNCNIKILKLVLLIVLLFSFRFISAQQLKDPDTIAIPQITIIDKKQDNYQVDQKLVDSSFMINNLNPSLADILLKKTSLYSRTYGPGLIVSYGIRGSNSSETVVLWNDFHVNNIMLASADISLLTASSDSKIKIEKNGFIPDGIGGSINLDDDLWLNKNRLLAGISYNSLQNFNFNGSIDFLVKNLKNSLSVIVEDNKNKYYFNRGESKIKTSNSEGNKIILKYNALYRKNNRTFKLFVLTNRLNRQIPPSRYESISDAAQLDEGFKSGIHYDIVRNSFVIKMRTGYFIDRLKYEYPLKNIYSDSYIYTFQSGLKLDWNILNNWLLRFDIYDENSKVVTDIYGKKSENRLYFSGLISGTIVDKLLVRSGLKSVYYNDAFVPLSPYIQLNYKLNKNIKAGLNAGKNFRLPGFNEKYWPDLGVPDLKYESSSFIDMKMDMGFKNILKFNTSIYFKKTKNMILWIPAGGIWKPENIEEVNSRGMDVDISYEIALNELKSEFIISYSYNKNTNSKEPDLNIIYSPKHILVSNQRFNYQSWRISLTQRYTDKVYVSFDNSEYIPSYLVMDISMSKDFKIKKNRLKYIIEINNIFNQDYETIKNYPMPGRYLSIGLKYIFFNQ